MNYEAFNLVKGQMPRTDLEMLMEERITPESDLPPMQPLFKMYDTPCCFRGELVADCGKAKSGKTTFLSVMITCAIGQKKVLALERLSDEPLKVLWIDTEQSQQSTQEILKERILPLCGQSSQDPQPSDDNHEQLPINDQLFAFNLRGLGYEVRSKMVSLAINQIKPDLVIIDGIKDLMTDINDAVKATVIMEHLMALAEANNCCIVSVLHQNKSEADRNMRGSIGTELTNKAFEVFECEYLERHEVFKVSQTFSRKHKMQRDFYYRLSTEGLPEDCDTPQERPRDEFGRWVSTKPNVDDLVKFFNDALEGRSQRKFGEVMAVALKKCGLGEAKAFYELVKEAEAQGVIHKMEHPDTKETWIVLDDKAALPFI